MLYTILSSIGSGIYQVAKLCILATGTVATVAIFTKPDEKLLDSCIKSRIQKMSTPNNSVLESIVKKGASVAVNKAKSVTIVDYVVFKTAEVTVPGMSDSVQAIGAFNNWFIQD